MSRLPFAGFVEGTASTEKGKAKANIWTDRAKFDAGYAGINWDLPIDAIRPFIITPGVKVGGYSQGDSKDLGYGIEFHDSIEVTYRFNDGQRVGAVLSHMSNASLGNKNPGTEIIQAVYSFPL